MKNPCISVVMPAYNTEKYIGEAIESILNQTFKDFELLVLNDSPDNKELEEIVKSYAKKDKRVKYYKNNKNLGVAKTRNKLLKMAKSEFIACMDSDDISSPDRFEKQIKYMKQHPKCGVLGTAYEIFGNRHNVIKNPKLVRLTDLLSGSCIGNPTVMMRKSVFDDNKIFYDENYNWCEDYELWSRLVFVTEIHNLPEVLLHYRWAEKNVSIVHSKKQNELADQVRQNILDKITSNSYTKNIIMNCVQNKKIKTGILLPKLVGRICCLFILNREARHSFRDKYVRN